MDDFHEREAVERLKRQKQDFDDYQDELAGRENTGKQQRFLRRDNENSAEGRESKRRSDMMTQLEMLLTNPSYAAAYTQTMTVLANAEQRTQEAIDRAEDAQVKAAHDLSQLQDSASTLPDGTRVYRAEDGTLYNEDGQAIEHPDSETVIIKDGAPSHENYLAHKKRAEDAQQRLDDLRRFQIEVLGEARDQMEDPDNPPSEEEMDRIRERVQDGLETIVAAPAPEQTREHAITSTAPLPTLD